MDGYDKEHFWALKNYKVYFKEENPLYERDRKYFDKYKETGIEGFTNKPIDKKMFNKYEDNYEIRKNNCNHLVKELCDHAGIKVEMDNLLYIIPLIKKTK